MQLNINKNLRKDTTVSKNDKLIVLLVGLALWLFIPIFGIFPLIFFIHLNRKSKDKLNFLVSLVVILTITIFVSSTDVVSDLAVYVDNYRQLKNKTPFEISGGQGLEFVMWLASYPIYKISNGSNYAFIFFWCFFFNAVTFWGIAKGFSPKNYGLLLLFIVANPVYFSFQIFLVRQYLATLIFLLAVVNIDRKPLMWGLYVLSLFTHIANIIYFPFLLLHNKLHLFKSKIVIFSFVLAGSILPFSGDYFISLAEKFARLLPLQYAQAIVAKTGYYGKERTNESDIIITLIENLVLLLIILILLKPIKFKTHQEKVLLILYPILFFLMFIGKDIHMFSNRVAFLLYPFGGLFYCLVIEHKWRMLKRFSIIFLLSIKLIYFNYYLYNVSIGNNPFLFLDEKVYNSTILDYIEIAAHNFTEDVKIKELPPRTIY